MKLSIGIRKYIVFTILLLFILKYKHVINTYIFYLYNLIFLLNIKLIIIDIYISLNHFILGFLFAIIIGIPIGILIGCFPFISNILNPVIEIIRPIPPLAWVPFSILWLKLTNSASSFIIFIGTIFPIILNIQNNILNIPKIYIETAKVLGCYNKNLLIKYVVIPSICISFYSDIKVASGVGWMCLVASEMFGINGLGLGYKISYYYYIQRMDLVIVYMILLGILGLILDNILKFLFKNKLYIQNK